MKELRGGSVVSVSPSEAQSVGLVGLALYAVALTFLADLAYLLTGRAPHLSGEELYRAGVMIFTLGSIVAVFAWMIRFTAHNNSQR